MRVSSSLKCYLSIRWQGCFTKRQADEAKEAKTYAVHGDAHELLYFKSYFGNTF